jgi:hypothetical protein
MSRVECMISSAAGLWLRWIVSCGDTQRSTFMQSPSGCRRYHGKIEATVTAVYAEVLWRVRESAVWLIAVCLEIDGGRCEQLLQLRGDHLII